MRLNPALNQCPKGPCTDAEYSSRLALMLKTFQGYGEAIKDDLESKIFRALIDGGFDSRDLQHMGDLVNPEIFGLEAYGNDPKFKEQEIKKTFAQFGAFKVEDNSVFFRPGLVNFDVFPEKIGRIANFFAARGPFDAAGAALIRSQWKDLLDSCAMEAKGKLYPGLNDGCKARFNRLYQNFRERYVPFEKTFARSPLNRLNDEVGQHFPALVSTSILYGKHVVGEGLESDGLFYQGLRDYRRGLARNSTSVEFQPDFEDVRFGYWGQPQDMAKASEVSRYFPGDLKSRKFLDINPRHLEDRAIWRHVLSLSPAEPGLSTIRVIGPEIASAGGWSDLHPVLVLKAMGCEKVVYITRRGGESKLAIGVAGLFGMSDAQKEELYTDSAQSSFGRSIDASDGVWCTNWDEFKNQEVGKMSADAYSGDLLLKSGSDPFFTSRAAGEIYRGGGGALPPRSRKIQGNLGCEAR